MNGHLLVIFQNDKETSQRYSLWECQQNEIRKIKTHQISLNYFYTLKSITTSRDSERNI